MAGFIGCQSHECVFYWSWVVFPPAVLDVEACILLLCLWPFDYQWSIFCHVVLRSPPSRTSHPLALILLITGRSLLLNQSVCSSHRHHWTEWVKLDIVWLLHQHWLWLLQEYGCLPGQPASWSHDMIKGKYPSAPGADTSLCRVSAVAAAVPILGLSFTYSIWGLWAWQKSRLQIENCH